MRALVLAHALHAMLASLPVSSHARASACLARNPAFLLAIASVRQRRDGPSQALARPWAPATAALHTHARTRAQPPLCPVSRCRRTYARARTQEPATSPRFPSLPLHATACPSRVELELERPAVPSLPAPLDQHRCSFPHARRCIRSPAVPPLLAGGDAISYVSVEEAKPGPLTV